MALMVVLAGINFTHIMDFMIMMPLGPQFKRIFGIGPEMWSSVVSSYTFAAAISGVAAIFFLDFFDRRKALIFLYSGFIISTFLVGFANSIEMLLAARALTGIFGGIIGALVLAIVGDVVENKDRGKAIGIVMTGFSAAASLGVPLGLLLGTKFGWQVAFFMIAAFSTILLGFAIKLVPSIDSHRKEKGTRLKSSLTALKYVVRDKNQLRAFAFTLLLVFGQFSIIPFISPYMVSNVGFEEIQLTYIYLFGGALTVFTSPFFGRIADKFGRLKTFQVLMVISLIPIYAITNMSPQPVWIVLIFSSMFFVFAAGRMVPASAMIIGTAHPDYRGTFMSLRSSLLSLGQGIAAFCAGLIMVEFPDGSFGNFHIVGYIGVGTSILSYFVLRKIKDQY
ncbi:MAG: DHA1 family inner membrane transport protein [Cryomorphaceae bacterium]|jgi:predicted MFS family arabinose efflux permease